jgi:4'-phosphopantetheinyl transferase EntD
MSRESQGSQFSPAEFFPAGVVYVGSRQAEGEPVDPDEAALVRRAAPKRRTEFLTGRACARRALRALGYANSALLIGPNRAPLWPDGAIGSITHCDGFSGAVAAHCRDFSSLGFDAEVNGVVSEELVPMICTQREAAEARDLASGAHWPTLVFSIKESVYKCLNPIWGIFIGFLEAEVRLDEGDLRFECEVTPEGRAAPTLVSGTYAFDGTHVFTFAFLSRPGPRRRIA